jgi:hypothetical protein
VTEETDDTEATRPTDPWRNPPPEDREPVVSEPRAPREPRPMIERIGLAIIAAGLATLFGGVAAAAWVGGEPFLSVMGVIGCVMTAWVGALTLFRG